ncbi:hypothetical protein WICPIJ_005431 [Wickerhamomyces pijperi]|uniref:Bromo domain-containing protein n=1 Tax=Wickerhamomyces pijperi TaxID=599730 RepID=A0A9P8TLX7_WICPI|nr:hypothetical protein WICPIJ_005431 [Wickerhamomyces pijperi]
MPPKGHKRKSSVSGAPAVKKTKVGNDLAQFMTSTLKLVDELKEGNYKLNEYFVKLPPKKLYPDYYEIIPQPISLQEIKGKVASSIYNSTESFLADFDLLSSNAHSYNESSSIVAINARKILDFVKDQVEQFNETHKDDSPVTENPVEPLQAVKKVPKIKIKLHTSPQAAQPAQEEPQSAAEDEAPSPVAPVKTTAKSSTKASTKSKVKSTTMAKAKPTTSTEKLDPSSLKQHFLKIIQDISELEEETINLAEPFLDEVDTEFIPDYLDFVTNPMALNTVKSNVMRNKFKSIDEFAAAIEQIWTNAQIYNKPEDLLYQDAATLRNFTNEKIVALKEELGNADKSLNLEQSAKGHTSAVESDIPVQSSEDSKVQKHEPAPVEESVVPQVEEVVPVPVVVAPPAPRKRGRPPKIKTLDAPEKSIAKLDATINAINEQLPPLQSEFIEQTEQTGYQEVEDPFEEGLTDIQRLRKKLTLNKLPEELQQSSIQIIEGISVTSSRSSFKQYTKQLSQPLFQSWFEYKFKSQTSKKTNHYTFTLPQHQASITFDASLNNALLQRKFQSKFSVNGEKIHVSPSIHYEDSEEDFHSLYEVKLAPGLNKLMYEVTLNKDANLPEDVENLSRLRNVPQKDYSGLNSGIDPEGELSTDVEKEESFSIWVQVV